MSAVNAAPVTSTVEDASLEIEYSTVKLLPAATELGVNDLPKFQLTPPLTVSVSEPPGTEIGVEPTSADRSRLY